LRAKLEETNNQLIGANKTARVLEATKVTFEGRCVTLGEFRNWIRPIYGQEIERKVNDKLESLAVLALRAGDNLWRMIHHEDNCTVAGGQ